MKIVYGPLKGCVHWDCVQPNSTGVCIRHVHNPFKKEFVWRLQPIASKRHLHGVTCNPSTKGVVLGLQNPTERKKHRNFSEMGVVQRMCASSLKGGCIKPLLKGGTHCIVHNSNGTPSQNAKKSGCL